MLDLEEYYQTQHLIEKINSRCGQLNYDKHLEKLSIDTIDSDYEEISMTLQLLAQMDFSQVLPHEENFVLRILESENLRLQEEAINAVSLWDKTNYLDRLKKITIKNRYLQEHYENIIARLEKNS